MIKLLNHLEIEFLDLDIILNLMPGICLVIVS